MNLTSLCHSEQEPLPAPGERLRWTQSPMSQEASIARRQVVITNTYGLHLRPAEKFVGLAAKFTSNVRILFRGRAYNGKSILDLMTLNAECGASLEVEASGPDADVAVAELAALVLARFHESDPYGTTGGPAS